MKTRRLAPLFALGVFVSGLVTLSTVGDAARPTLAESFPVRGRLPQLAADSASAPSPSPSASATPSGLAFCTVSNVVDGDTIDVTGCADSGRIRFILVSTPEINPGECFGKQSTDYTRQKLLNRQVGLERDRSEDDVYGRKLRYIWVDGELFNERLVRDGYATLTVYEPDVKYRTRIAAAEQEARANSRGLWPVCGGLGVPGTPTPQASATASPSATLTPPGTPTATPTAAGACSSATAEITALDKGLEVVTISGSGNLNGWYLISVRGSQRFDFPPNFLLSGSVQVKSGVGQFANSASQLWWTAAAQWNNSEDDDAVLYNCLGQQVDYFDDGD